MSTINLTNSSKTSGGSWLEGYINWTETVDNKNNQSTVVTELYVRKKANVTMTIATSGTWSFKLSVGGEETSSTKYLDVLEEWVKVATKTKKIDHNSDGSKSITISGSVTGPSGTSLAGKTTSGSKSVSLTKIPRAASITSATNVTLLHRGTESLSNKCVIKWTSPSEDFYYKLKFTCNNHSITDEIGTLDDGTEYYCEKLMTVEDWAPYITNSTTATCTISLYTYSDSNYDTQVGNAKTKNITITIPTSVKPSLDIFKSIPNESWEFANAENIYVQNHSGIDLTIDKCTSAYGSQIDNFSISLDGTTIYDSNTQPTGIKKLYYHFKASGQYVFTAQVKDKRGRYSDRQYIVVEVLPYAPPTIDITSIERIESSVVIKYQTTYSPLIDNNDVSHNQLTTVEVYRKQSIDSGWLSTPIKVSTPLSVGTLVIENCDVNTSYDFIARVIDKTGYDGNEGSSKVVSVASSFRPINITADGKGIAIGKMAEQSNLFECDLKANFNKAVNVGGNITFDGGMQTAERDIIFQNTAGDNVHQCVLYGGDPSSEIGIGIRDLRNNRNVLSYNDMSKRISIGSHIDFGAQSEERDIIFESQDGEHKCALFGGNPDSEIGIGLYDTKNSRRVLTYNDVDNVIDLGNSGTTVNIHKSLTIGSHTTPVGSVLYGTEVSISMADKTASKFLSLTIPSGSWIVTGSVYHDTLSNHETVGMLRATLSQKEKDTDVYMPSNNNTAGTACKTFYGSTLGGVIEVILLTKVSSDTTIYLTGYQSSGSALTCKGNIRAMRIA